MNYVIIILALLNLGFLIYNLTYKKKCKKQLIKEEIAKQSEEYKEAHSKLYKSYMDKNFELTKELSLRRTELDNELNQLRLEIVDAINQKQELISCSKAQIDEELKKYKSMKIDLTENEINTEKQKMEKGMQEFIEAFERRKLQILCEMSSIEDELNDYQSTRAAINQAILREREIKEKEDFYKLQLSKSSIEDITIIMQLLEQVKNKEIFSKVTYEAYYKKALSELVKRVTGGKVISGIYKITHIPTGDIYIGKSTNIGERWKQHIKSSLNIGTIAHSSLHTAMEYRGVWNFTFEIVEEVPREKLTEREKYYINFYESDIYGLNQKNG